LDVTGVKFNQTINFCQDRPHHVKIKENAISLYRACSNCENTMQAFEFVIAYFKKLKLTVIELDDRNINLMENAIYCKIVYVI